MATWKEIEQAEKENRHELVISGAEFSSRIESNGIDKRLFTLSQLNFLEISKTSLNVIPDEIGQMTNLSNLVLCLNKISQVPTTLGELKKLKLLDMSRNEIEELPDSIGALESLQTLNLTGNKLKEIPAINGLVNLHHLDVSYNELETLPDGIPCAELCHLSDIKANNNKLKEIPEELAILPSLKCLDVSENCLTDIPPDLSECTKLKELHFIGNKLSDRKLARMGDKVKIKAIFDYLYGIMQKQRKEGGKGKGGKKKKNHKKEKSEVEDLCSNFMKVMHFNDGDDCPEKKGVTIKVMPEVLNVRPYIVACIIRNLNFNKTKNMYKRFITLQTKLHETVCNKRQAATIATHDLDLVNSPLVYEARAPAEMMLRPLFRQKDTSAEKLVSKLRQEAEELRKEKKRNTISGIHKHLDLLKGKSEYPCLVDNNNVIISFPPITNCDSTKISRETNSILIEVTSSTNLDTCKKVMQELLQSMLEMGVGHEHPPNPQPVTDEEMQGAAAGDIDEPELTLTSDQCLVIEQVKVLNEEGGLKVVYPSRVDLMSEAFRVIRE